MLAVAALAARRLSCLDARIYWIDLLVTATVACAGFLVGVGAATAFRRRAARR